MQQKKAEISPHEISPQIRRKRLFSAQSGGGMTLQEFQGLSGPRTFGAGSLTLPSPPPPGTLRDSAPGAEKPRLFANRRPLPPSGMYVRGPEEAALSQTRGQSKGGQRPCQPPASHTRPPRCPGRSEGFPASRGLVAPHALPASRGILPGRKPMTNLDRNIKK